MSSVIIAGNTSGTITLDAPAVAGTTTLTLPATTGTVLTSVSPASDLPSSIKGPAFSVYLSTSQTISSGVNTKVAFNSEYFDTASCFNTSTYRFTPTTAGYYSFSVIVQPQSNSAISGYSFYLPKNGADGGASNQICYANGNNGFSLNPAYSGSLMYYLNGSTDFVELYFNQYTGSSKLLYGSVDGGTTILSGFLARSA
jgi:hypothetical protein